MAQLVQTNTSPTNIISPIIGASALYWYNNTVYLRNSAGNDFLIGPNGTVNAQLTPGTLNGQVLYWNSTSSQWEASSTVFSENISGKIGSISSSPMFSQSWLGEFVYNGTYYLYNGINGTNSVNIGNSNSNILINNNGINITGSVIENSVIITSTNIVSDYMYRIFLDNGGGPAIILTLPVSNIQWRKLWIKNIGTTNATIALNGNSLEGSASNVTLVIYDQLDIIWTGSEWVRIS